MIRVTRTISIDEEEIKVRFVGASGPGGQNVNKVATAAQLRFDVAGSGSLPADVKDRLARLAGRRITERGILTIDARRYRSQQRNRADAVQRLLELLRRAAARPTPRRKTAPTPASRRRRLETKRRHSRAKQMRRSVGEDQN